MALRVAWKKKTVSTVSCSRAAKTTSTARDVSLICYQNLRDLADRLIYPHDFLED